MTRRIFNLTLTLTCVFFMISCNDKSKNNVDPQEYDSLKVENNRLKLELDSLYSIIKKEEFGLMIFNNSYGKKLNQGDSIDLLVGAMYNRPNYIHKIKLELINDQKLLDSLSNYTGTYDFKYQYDFSNKEEILHDLRTKIPYKSGDIAVIRGEVSIWEDGAIKVIPIEYDLDL